MALNETKQAEIRIKKLREEIKKINYE